MTSTEAQKPQCPVCHKADQVKKLETAYNEGMERFAPPPLPTKKVPIMRFMAAGMILVGFFVFFTIVLVGSGIFGQSFNFLELAFVIGTIVSILIALGLSYYAFTVVVRADQEASKLYPAWDHAMENWQHLRYCARDKIVFDPQSASTISDAELASLMSVEEKQEQQIAQKATSAAH
jgi:hypothetical protein